MFFVSQNRTKFFEQNPTPVFVKIKFFPQKKNQSLFVEQNVLDQKLERRIS